VSTSYRYRTGTRIVGVKAADAARELKRLQRLGRLQPPEIVEAARPEEAPLHQAFEWDDGVAAEEFRLIQARQLIRAVQVVQNGQEPRSIYAYVPSQENGYEPIEALIQHPDRFVLALNSALEDVSSAQRRVEELREAAGSEPDRLAILTLAAQALQTAEQAIRTLH
jgi:hypothetical protein